LAFKWKVKDRIEILFSKKDPRISEADIITNLGFVRPLDAPFLHRLKPSAVIPLMWETWEFRSTDLDLAESIRQGIMVLGTNEDHPDLQQFHYVGSLAKKLLFEMDIEVFHSQIVLVGGGKFGTTAYHSLCASGANVYQIRPAYGDSLNNTTIKMHLADCDAIVFVEHQYSEKLIGDGGQITAQELHSLNPGIVVVHIAGNVDYKDLTHLKIPIRPFRFSSHGYMSVTTAYLGPKPLIQLHSAGLKVGEAMARARLAGLDCKTAAELALKDSPAMDFSPQQKKIS
jgi:hypothetical protein